MFAKRLDLGNAVFDISVYTDQIDMGFEADFWEK